MNLVKMFCVSAGLLSCSLESSAAILVEFTQVGDDVRVVASGSVVTDPSWVWERDSAEVYVPGTGSRMSRDFYFEFIPSGGVLESYTGTRLQDYLTISFLMRDVGAFDDAFRIAGSSFQLPGVLDGSAPMGFGQVSVDIDATFANASVTSINASSGVITDVFEISGFNPRSERLVQFLVHPVAPAAVPEPTSSGLLALSLIGALLRRSRK